jgi:bifunctional UDP-N-acetylglucosamine pyrophosphorylase/glucosamine-1-phosphate N-acetyltransferase
MIGVILCSGYGRKIWPFSDWWQKCCIPIANKPNVLRIVEQLKKLDFKKIYVITSYNSQMAKYVLRNSPGIFVIEEQKAEGTAKSLLNCLKEQQHEDVFVVYGDTVVDDASLNAVLNRFKNTNLPVMLTQKLKDTEQAIDWMCAMVQNHKVTAILGHPRSHYVNVRLAGVFALNKEIIEYLITNPGYMENVCVGNMPPKQAELEQSLQMMLEDGCEIGSVDVIKYFVDMDKPWHILEANRTILDEIFISLKKNIIEENAYIDDSAVIQGKIRLGRGSKIGKNVIIKGDVWIGENTIVDYGAIIEGKVVIGDNCRITDYCKISSYTTIGNKNRIGYNAEICGVTFDGASIVHNCEIFGVIGSYTDIAAGCLTGTLRFDDSQTIHSIKGKKEFPGEFSNAIYIGDHTRTGVGCIFFPGVKVGINCAIWPGAIIDKDIESNTLIIAEQNRITKRWGPEKYGW